MKKLLAGLLTLSLSLGLVACGGATTPAAESKSTENTDAPQSKVKVALMISALGDFSFNDSANDGMKRLTQDKGDLVETKVIEYGYDKSKEEPALVEAAEGDFDIVIVSSSMKPYIEEYAAEYPDKKFIVFDDEMDYSGGKYTNVYSIVYNANEAAFLGGYLAAQLSETNVLGFLGGMDIPVISDFLVGFIQGAQLAKPDIKVSTSYVGAWGDSAKGKEQSLAMVNQNVSLIFGVAGGSGAGAIEVGKEKDILILGVDSDQAQVYEAQGKHELANVIVSSVLKNVGDSLYRAVDLHLQGKLPYGAKETLGLKENGVGLADNKFYQEKVSAEIREEIVKLTERVANGEIEVKSGYGMSPEEISEIRNSVKP